jgi:hypothetical protein
LILRFLQLSISKAHTLGYPFLSPNNTVIFLLDREKLNLAKIAAMFLQKERKEICKEKKCDIPPIVVIQCEATMSLLLLDK